MTYQLEPDELISAIKAKYRKHWELNDLGHREHHFNRVYAAALVIVERLSITGIDQNHIAIVAYFHDLFCWSRENHHFLSEAFIRTTDCALVKAACKSREEIDLVANACLQHRKSVRVESTHILSEIMRAADREAPKGADTILDRSIHYHSAQGVNAEAARAKAVAHVKQIYGKDGYEKLPPLYRKAFDRELSEMFAVVDAL